MKGIDRVDLQMSFLAVVWGSAFLGIKVLGEHLDAYQLTWFRYLPFPLLFGTYVLLRRRDVFRQVTGRDWVVMGLLGFLGVVGYHFPLNWGLTDTSDGVQVTAATASILVATNPLWTLAVAVAQRKERLTVGALAGTVTAFAGVALVILLGRGEAELTLARKALIILLAPLAWAVYSVSTKPLVGRYGGLFVTGVSLSIGTATLLPIGIAYGTEPLAGLPGAAWAWLLFLALVSTAAGYAIWNDALKHRSASSVAVFVYAQPVVTALLGWLYLGERLTLYFVLGAALVLAGVVQVNRARVKVAAAAAPKPA